MVIKNQEQAEEYLGEVYRHLDELRELAVEAGLYPHAGMWCTISAAFHESSEEIETVVDVMKIYLKNSCKRHGLSTDGL